MTRGRKIDNELSALTGIPASEIRARIKYFERRFKKSEKKLGHLLYLSEVQKNRILFSGTHFRKIGNTIGLGFATLGAAVAVSAATFVPTFAQMFGPAFAAITAAFTVAGVAYAGFIAKRTDYVARKLAQRREKPIGRIFAARSLREPEYGPDVFLQDSYLCAIKNRLDSIDFYNGNRIVKFVTEKLREIKLDFQLLFARERHFNQFKPLEVRHLANKLIKEEFQLPHTEAFRDATYKGIRWVDELLIKLGYNGKPPTFQYNREIARISVSKEMRKALNTFKSELVALAPNALDDEDSELAKLEKLLDDSLDVGVSPEQPADSIHQSPVRRERNGAQIFASRRWNKAPKHDFAPMRQIQ